MSLLRLTIATYCCRFPTYPLLRLHGRCVRKRLVQQGRLPYPFSFLTLLDCPLLARSLSASFRLWTHDPCCRCYRFGCPSGDSCQADSLQVAGSGFPDFAWSEIEFAFPVNFPDHLLGQRSRRTARAQQPSKGPTCS